MPGLSSRTLLSLGYFFLTHKLEGGAAWAPRLGRYFMMAAFGAAGNTVMGRYRQPSAGSQFIFLEWLGM